MTSPIHYIYTITDFRNHQHPFFAISRRFRTCRQQAVMVYKHRFFATAGDGGLTRADLMPQAMPPTSGRQVFSLDNGISIRKSKLLCRVLAYFNSFCL